MATLTNAEKAPILVDGQLLTVGTNIASSDEAVLRTQNESDGTVAAVGQGAGSAVLSLDIAGRHGSLLVEVSEAPLAVTLGAPVPK